MRAMVFWGIADSGLKKVVLFFSTRGEAEHELGRILEDEPTWVTTLSLVLVDFSAPEPAVIPCGSNALPRAFD